MSQAHQKKIDKFFKQRAIAYQPGLAIIFRSVPAAIMLNQLLYWHMKGSRKDGFIFKTEVEMFFETGLTRTMQSGAIKKLLEYGFIDYKLAGIPAKKCYRVNFLNVQNQLPRLKETCNLKYLNPPVTYDDNLRPITENTHRTTTQSTSSIGSILEGKRYTKK